MAMMTDELQLTVDEERALRLIQTAAKDRHEARRLYELRRGRKDFPELPFECSWAYEEEFRRMVRDRR